MDNNVQKLPYVPPFQLLLIFRLALLSFLIPIQQVDKPFPPSQTSIDSQTRNIEQKGRVSNGGTDNQSITRGISNSFNRQLALSFYLDRTGAASK